MSKMRRRNPQSPETIARFANTFLTKMVKEMSDFAGDMAVATGDAALKEMEVKLMSLSTAANRKNRKRRKK